MKNKNINPVYFRSFVGTWKRLSQPTISKAKSMDTHIKFNNDCTFDLSGFLQGIGGVHEGTVNGDVEEISVDGDGHQNDLVGIKGKIVLSISNERYVWAFRIKKEFEKNKQATITKLEMKKNKVRQFFAFASAEIAAHGKKPGRKKMKV